MNPNGAPQGANDERLAGGLMNVVQQLQKNRFGGVRELQGSPIGAEAKQGANVLNAIKNEKEQDAASAPGAFQDEERQEPGRQRNVGQGQTQGGFR
jgi:hypothetical protein